MSLSLPLLVSGAAFAILAMTNHATSYPTPNPNLSYDDYYSKKDRADKDFAEYIKQRVFIISGTQCAGGKEAERLLQARGIYPRVVDWDVYRDPFFMLTASDEYISRTQYRKPEHIPLIYICGRYIGDYRDLRQMDEQGQLQQEVYRC